VSHNPYAPPAAAVSDTLSGLEPPPKPRTVTFTQIVCWLVLAFAAIALIRYTAFTIYYWANLQDRDSIYLQLALRAAIVAYFLTTLLLLHKRRPLGRWLGVLTISSFFGLPVAGFINMDWPAEIGSAEILGAALGTVLLTAPVVAWLYLFGFSRKARAYFNGVPATDASTRPPAPH
jgi:hypothetical protein